MGVRGDFGKLDRMVERLGTLGSPSFRQELAQRLGAVAMKQLRDGFREERDPYGQPWARLKHRNGKILRDTGRLANSYSVQPAPGGFEISTRVKYAAPHQYGAFVAPHSRITRQERMADVETGRFLSATKAMKRKLVAIASWSRQTFAEGITIPQRQMVPMKSTGGMGAIWGAALKAEALRAIRELFGRR